MIILRNKFFSKKDKEGKKKIKISDKLGIASAKMYPKKMNRVMADYWDVDDEEKSKEAGKKLAKADAIGGGIYGGLLSGTAGAILAGKKGAVVGTTVGAATGAASGYLGTKLGEKGSRALRKSSEKYREHSRRGRDMYRVGAGDMTKEEFIEKYGK